MNLLMHAAAACSTYTHGVKPLEIFHTFKSRIAVKVFKELKLHRFLYLYSTLMYIRKLDLDL